MKYCLDVKKFRASIAELPEEEVCTFRDEKKLMKELNQETGKKGLASFDVFQLISYMDMADIFVATGEKEKIEYRIRGLLACPDVAEPKLM